MKKENKIKDIVSSNKLNQDEKRKYDEFINIMTDIIIKYGKDIID